MSVPSSRAMRTSSLDPLRRPTPCVGHPRPAHTAKGHAHRPSPAIADLEPVVEGERAHPFVEGARPPALVDVAERLLVRGAGEVGVQHVGVGRVDHRRFGWPGEHLVGMGHVPLVELVVAGHQDDDRLLRFAPGPSGLLPHRRDGAGEPVEHAGVEAPDVDAELERGGGDDPPEVAAEQLALDLASLGGQVAAAVGPHLPGQLRGQPPTHLGGDQLGSLAAAAERDRAMTTTDELGDQHRGLAVGRGRPRPPLVAGGLPIARSTVSSVARSIAGLVGVGLDPGGGVVGAVGQVDGVARR